MTDAVRGSRVIRPAREGDVEQILDLLSVSLGWSVDERFRRYFRWKHDSAPLGPSPAWVAVEEDSLVGYRAFVRWELERPGCAPILAARAVDVATAPAARGRGVFADLASHALESLRTSGVELVFTTPNEAAGAGWVNLGARAIGRVPVAIRPRSPTALPRLLQARTPAERWPVETHVGSGAADALGDPGVEDLLRALAAPIGIRTLRTVPFLRWRYGFDLLGYRTLAPDDDPSRGLAVFRLRRRGAAVEAALCDVLAHPAERAWARSLPRTLARETGADYVIAAGSDRARGHGVVRLPGQGPLLYAMSLSPQIELGDITEWDLQLGDVELL